MIECPICHKPGISAWRKSCLGPAVPTRCKQCGKKVGVPYSEAMMAILPFIASILISFFVYSLFFKGLTILIGIIIMSVAYIKYVPLINMEQKQSEKSKEKKNYWKPYFKIMFWIFIVIFLLLLFDKSPLYEDFFIALVGTVSLMIVISPFYLVYIHFHKEKKLREHEIKDDKKIIENVYKKFELKDWKRNISAILPICLIGFLIIIGFISLLASTPTPQKIVYNKQDLLKNNIDEIEDVSDVGVGYEKDNPALIVSLSALYDPSFTESMIVLGNDREGMLYKSSQIFKKVFPMDISISIVRVYVYKYEKDAYGNKIKKDLGSVELSRQEYNKINWEGFSSHNLPKIAKVDYEIHNEREAQIEAMRQYMENS